MRRKGKEKKDDDALTLQMIFLLPNFRLKTPLLPNFRLKHAQAVVKHGSYVSRQGRILKLV